MNVSKQHKTPLTGTQVFLRCEATPLLWQLHITPARPHTSTITWGDTSDQFCMANIIAEVTWKPKEVMTEDVRKRKQERVVSVRLQLGKQPKKWDRLKYLWMHVCLHCHRALYRLEMYLARMLWKSKDVSMLKRFYLCLTFAVTFCESYLFLLPGQLTSYVFLWLPFLLVYFIHV